MPTHDDFYRLINNWMFSSEEPDATVSADMDRFYLCLFTADPGAGFAVTDEVSGSGYARLDIGWSGFSAFDDVTGFITNIVEWQIGPLPACVVTHIGLAFNATGDNLKMYDALSTPLTFQAGDLFVAAQGDIKLKLRP